jgi:diaminohydroxyphosphoribosylaminopyrimidine deaminase/5-amino-6-(5-phosphoribosylamino)uracil reductase
MSEVALISKVLIAASHAKQSMEKPDEFYMQIAIEHAKTGEGFVEPNPMVGCVLVRDGVIIGQGAHEKFGGPHAEIHAIESVESRGKKTEGSTAYVTLEPCSHSGKTGPCTQALINAKVARVVVGCEDPNPLVGGKGIEQLQAAGIAVTTGILAESAQYILAPYLKRMKHNKPWIIAKWAMTLDGKIATSSGNSKWISNEHSRAIVHAIRGRVDGVMVGAGTAIADDPMLNARPPGARLATRIVVDSSARIPLDSKLATTTINPIRWSQLDLQQMIRNASCWKIKDVRSSKVIHMTRDSACSIC